MDDLGIVFVIPAAKDYDAHAAAQQPRLAQALRRAARAKRRAQGSHGQRRRRRRD